MGLLRFLLAVMVIWSHSGTSFAINSALLVPIFFLISGFYMALIIDTKPEYVKVKVFYFSRFLRLYPSYFVVLALTIIAILIFHAPIERANGFIDRLSLYQIKENLSNTSIGIKLFYVITNFTIIGYDYVIYIKTSAKDLFDFATEIDNRFIKNMPIGQMWSLGFEIWFYLLTPFIIRNFYISSAVVVIAICCKIFLRDMTPQIISGQVSIIDFYLFFLGALSYRFVKDINFNYFFAAVIVILIVAIQVPCLTNDKNLLLQMGSQVLFIFAISLAIPSLFSSTKNNKWDRFVGDLSYPIYLSHFLIDYLVQNIFSLSGDMRFLLTATGTIIFSIILLVFVERPLDKFRHSRAKQIVVIT